MNEMKLEDLKLKSPTELLGFAEEVGVENASTMRKQELMFATLKQLASKEVEITASASSRCCRTASASCARRTPTILPGPDDIYVSPSQIRRFALRTGDTVEARSAARRRASATSRCSRSTRSTSRTPKGDAHKIHFDNLTPLYPDEVAQDGDRGSDHQGLSRASSTSSVRSARASARSSSRRRAPARRCCCRTSPTRSPPTTPSATSSCCSSTSGPRR